MVPCSIYGSWLIIFSKCAKEKCHDIVSSVSYILRPNSSSWSLIKIIFKLRLKGKNMLVSGLDVFHHDFVETDNILNFLASRFSKSWPLFPWALHGFIHAVQPASVFTSLLYPSSMCPYNFKIDSQMSATETEKSLHIRPTESE